MTSPRTTRRRSLAAVVILVAALVGLAVTATRPEGVAPVALNPQPEPPG